MYRTRDDIIWKVLAILGKADGYVSAEDSQKVDRNIDGAVSTLSGLGIVDVGDVGELGPNGGQMEPAFFEPFCAYLANIVSVEFDMPHDVYAARAEAAKATLRTLAAPPRTRRTLRLDPAVRSYQRSYYDGAR